MRIAHALSLSLVTKPLLFPWRIAGLLEVIGWLLALVVVFVVGAFVNAYAAFLLLPLALAGCTFRFFRHRSHRLLPAKWRTVLAGNFLILALLLSLLFLGFESYYRFVCDQTDALTSTLVSNAWYERHFHTNALGMRDNINYSIPLTPGKRRITFVGDSFTAGFGVKDVEDRFVNRIRHLHPEWEIHAMAKPGLDTSTELLTMHNLTVSNHYQLDQVVLVYNINDIGEVMPRWMEEYKKLLADRFRKSWLCQNSYVVNLFYLRWQLQRNAYMQNYFDEVEAAYKGPLWETQKTGLHAFGNMTLIRGGRLLVVTFPFLHAPLRFQSVHQQLDEYWTKRGVPHLDLLAIFSNQPPAKITVNAHDAHPNAYAHALATKAIDEFLKQQISKPTETRANAP